MYVWLGNGSKSSKEISLHRLPFFHSIQKLLSGNNATTIVAALNKEEDISRFLTVQVLKGFVEIQ